MFYCDSCAAENEWPSTAPLLSRGKCEVCNRTAVCNDLPSRHLSEIEEARTEARELAEAIQSVKDAQTEH